MAFRVQTMTLEDVRERPSHRFLQGRKLSVCTRAPETKSRHRNKTHFPKQCYTNVVLNRHTLLVSFYPKQRKQFKPRPLLRDPSIMVTSNEPFYVARGSPREVSATRKTSIIKVALAKLRCPEYRCSTRESGRRPLFRKSLGGEPEEDESVLVSHALSIDIKNYSS